MAQTGGNLLREYRDSIQKIFRENKYGMLYSRRHLFAGDAGANIIAQLASAAFNTALLLILMDGADAVKQAGYLATISIIQSLMGAAQLLSPMVFEPMRRRRGVILTMMAVCACINLVGYPLLALLPMELEPRMTIYILLVAIYTGCAAVYAPAWSVLTVHSLPEVIRSDYYTVNNIFVAFLNAILSFLLGLGLDWFKEQSAVLTGILLFRGAAVLVTCAQFWCYSRVEEPEYNAGKDRIRLREIITAPFQSGKFLLICGLHTVIGIATTAAGAFYNAYLLDGARISYTYFGLANVVGLPSMFISLPFWNRLVQKRGWLWTFAVSLALYAGAYFFNGLVTENTQFLYLVSAGYCCLISGGWSLGNANLCYLYLPEKLQSSCVTFYNLLYVLGCTVSAWFAKKFVEWTDGKFFRFLGLELENRAYICFVGFLLLLASESLIVLLLRKEKKEKRT